MTMISVIIPAHNEASVIARTLHAMTNGAKLGELDVIVVCNGCSDDTAAVARSFGAPVRVVETDVAGKTHALNLGDETAKSFPRIYADADVVVSVEAIRILAGHLESGNVLAAAPTPNFDLAECSWAVRACYEIRSLLPSAQQGVGGSGVYALSESGRRRFGEFPSLTADDGYVRIQFREDERETLSSAFDRVPPQNRQELDCHENPSAFRFPRTGEPVSRSLEKPGRKQSQIIVAFVQTSAIVEQADGLLSGYIRREVSGAKAAAEWNRDLGAG